MQESACLALRFTVAEWTKVTDCFSGAEILRGGKSGQPNAKNGRPGERARPGGRRRNSSNEILKATPPGSIREIIDGRRPAECTVVFGRRFPRVV